MQRRNFLKTGLIGGSLLVTTSVSKGVESNNDGEFTQVFNKCFIPKDKIFTHQIPEDTITNNYRLKRRLVFLDEDKINKLAIDNLMVHQFIKSDDVDFDCASTLLSSALDKNIVVYYDKRVVNKNCLEKMSNYLHNGYMTDLFHGPDTKVEYVYPHLMNHCIDRSKWSRIKDYYLNKLKGTLPDGYSNLVLAINRNTNHFILGYRGAEVSITVLKNSGVILGAV